MVTRHRFSGGTSTRPLKPDRQDTNMVAFWRDRADDVKDVFKRVSIAFKTQAEATEWQQNDPI